MLARLLEVLAGAAVLDAVACRRMRARVRDAVGAVVLDVVVGERHPVDARAREDLGQLRLAGEDEAVEVETPVVR